VIHGGSGVPMAAAGGAGLGLAHLQVQHRHGTQDGLRDSPARRRESDPDRFDRVQILKDTHDPVMAAAQAVIRGFGAAGRA
jgi:fructose-bisphosphate aldolase class II